VIKFDVLNRFTGTVQFTAEIDCDDSTATGLKLGLAVNWAIKSRANLRRANLYGANLYGANLYGANLSGANLSRADLYGANLYGADLYGANLYGANLSRAKLSRAKLYGANLYGADLYGADLYGADRAINGFSLNYGWYAVKHLDGSIKLTFGCEEHNLEDWPNLVSELCFKYEEKNKEKYENILFALIDLISVSLGNEAKGL
jgi:hypothetical protein